MRAEKEFIEINKRLSRFSNSLKNISYIQYRSELIRFLSFIEKTPLLIDRIKDAGKCELDLKEQFKIVMIGGTVTSLGCGRFDLGSSTDEEIKNIYAILCFIREENIDVVQFYGYGIGGGGSLHENVFAFDREVVQVFIEDLQCYITDIIDDKTTNATASISIQTNANSIANVAIGNASIVSNNITNKGIDVEASLKLIDSIRLKCDSLAKEEKEELCDALDVAEDDLTNRKSDPAIWRLLKRIFEKFKGVVGFANEIGNLILTAEKIIGN